MASKSEAASDQGSTVGSSVGEANTQLDTTLIIAAYLENLIAYLIILHRNDGQTTSQQYTLADVRRSHSEVTLASINFPPLHHHQSKLVDRSSEIPDSTEPARSKSFVSLPGLLRSSFSIEPHLEETAEVLGVNQPTDNSISPWAAVMAMSTSSPTPSESGDDAPSEKSFNHMHDVEAGVIVVGTSETSRLERRRTTHMHSSSASGLHHHHNHHLFPKSPLVPIDIDNIKRDFILKLSRTFFMYGAPSHRLEHHLTEVSKALDVDAQFFLLPALIMISFGGENYKSNVHFIKQPGGMNMSKLAQVNALCLTLTNGLIDIHNAVELLDGIRNAKENPWWVSLLTFPVSSFCFSLLLFQTTWLESAMAGVLGVIVGVLSVFGGKHTEFSFMPEFFGSLISAFLSRAIQPLFHSTGLCYDHLKVTLAALVIFLPGMSLTISIIELSTRNMVSGTVRMFGALFTAMLLGFGMTIGASLVAWDSAKSQSTPICEATSQLWGLIFFVPMAMSINLLFQGSKHQWPIMTLTSGIGYVTAGLLNLVPALKAQPTAVNAIASAVIGITGNIYARCTNDVAVAPIFTAVWIQVPGSLSVKSTLGFFVGTGGDSGGSSGGVVDGISFTFQMLTISISLALGLFVATMAVWPLKRPRYEYLTI
ncbi:hypothetical protein BDR26DRAFT_851018 [Obelidium mucronatum]|nr:hypothetical protein BDR26DRAFT_851018 [Obelidium mucronatum]